MKKIALLFYLFIFTKINAGEIFTSDITNFWIAFDSVATVKNNEQKIELLNKYYFSKATDALKDYINVRGLKAEDWLKSIEQYPKFWKSVRHNTLSVLEHKEQIEKILIQYKKTYPRFIEPTIYFSIGVIKTGGTTSPDKIFIGTEITMADSTTDSSELIPFFKNYFKQNNNLIQMITHEITHTQQKLITDSLRTVLSSCLIEGSCDFIAEVILKKPYNMPHIKYGNEHKIDLLKKIVKEYKNKDYSNWLYNYKSTKDEPADLGYYVGYLLSKEYYSASKNKSKAIAELIELNWLDSMKLEQILHLTLKNNHL